MSDEMPGRPIWIELYTADTDAAKAFYSGLFGWTVQDSGQEFGNYVLFLRDGAPLPELHGTANVLSDAGFSDAEALDWLLDEEESLGTTPIAALRAGRKAEVRRVAQALA